MALAGDEALLDPDPLPPPAVNRLTPARPARPACRCKAQSGRRAARFRCAMCVPSSVSRSTNSPRPDRLGFREFRAVWNLSVYHCAELGGGPKPPSPDRPHRHDRVWALLPALADGVDRLLGVRPDDPHLLAELTTDRPQALRIDRALLFLRGRRDVPQPRRRAIGVDREHHRVMVHARQMQQRKRPVIGIAVLAEAQRAASAGSAKVPCGT